MLYDQYAEWARGQIYKFTGKDYLFTKFRDVLIEMDSFNKLWKFLRYFSQAI